MNCKIDLGVWGSVFAVPACVVDEHIKIADGKQLKTLLYLLRDTSVPKSAAEIAEAVGITRYEVEDALIFWKNAGVLAERGGELVPPAGEPSCKAEAPQPVSAAAKVKLTADTQFPPREIASAVTGDGAVRYLFETFERLAGRPTKHAERNTLMLLTEEAGLPCEVAIMLVEYCFSVDKATPAYMKSAALDWAESGVNSIEKAEERIKLLQSRSSLEGRLRAKFALASSFSRSQKEFIAQWSQAEYPDELIDEAYDLCMKNTGKLNMKYMDTVLKSWADKGIKSAAQLSSDKKPEKIGSSFDIDDFEQAAYAKYKKLGGGKK